MILQLLFLHLCLTRSDCTKILEGIIYYNFYVYFKYFSLYMCCMYNVFMYIFMYFLNIYHTYYLLPALLLI